MIKIISILVLVVGLLGLFYSYSEFQNINEIKQTFEYKANQTIDNLALNYLGIDRENVYSLDIKRRKKQATIVSIGSILFVVAGILLLIIKKKNN